MQIYMLE